MIYTPDNSDCVASERRPDHRQVGAGRRIDHASRVCSLQAKCLAH
ncbi:MAG TPA: hypothetical protein VGA56_13905 [Opitutaceae bacterium]